MIHHLTTVLQGAAKPDDSVVSPGLAGFLVTFAIAVATLFLIKSMVKHLRKVRYGPDPSQPDLSQPGEVPQPRTRPENGDAQGGDTAGTSEHR